MTHIDSTLAELARWHEMQQQFWTEASVATATGPGIDTQLPEWLRSNDLVDHLLADFDPEPEAHDQTARPPEWLALLKAGQTYRHLIGQTWEEVQRDFRAHCIALHDPNGMMPEWRAYRDRWLAIAESAFIRLQRNPEFLTTQRQVVMAWCAWFSRQPEGVRRSVQLARSAAQQARQAALSLMPVQIAQTPKTVVWQQGNTTVSRYHPLRPEAPDLGPILICYGLIGRQTMTDLLPQRSLVRNLLAMGVDVFVIDWGSAGPEDAGHGLDHYAHDHLGKAIESVREAADAPRITLMGICQGGVLALCHAAQNQTTLNGVICTGTPVDFHADQQDPDLTHGLLNLWIRSLGADAVGALIDAERGLNGEFLGGVFNQLNPVRTLARYMVDLPQTFPVTSGDPGAMTAFMAMETWLADRPDVPEALARTWLADLYHDNALVEGRIRLNGQPVDLRNIAVPVLNIIATGDHIVPPPCSAALSRFTAPGRYSECAIPAGHVGVFVGRQAQTRTAPRIVSWLRDQAENHP